MHKRSNDNWADCPKCGAPVLVDPATQLSESCANCNPRAVRQSLVVGGTLLFFGFVAIVLLAVLAISILL